MTEPSPAAGIDHVVLDVAGMTCAACVRRVERALQKLDGVDDAAVNLATQEARVVFEPHRVSRDALTAAVVAAGYEVLPPRATPAAADEGRSAHEQLERRALLRDLAIAASASVPLLVLGMAHGAIPFAAEPAGRIVQCVLATIVLFGPGRRFLRGGFVALRHRSPDMNTLVSLGAFAAWAWSTAATFAPRGFGHGDHPLPHVYFEATGAILSFVLLGKFLESRARWRLGDAVRSLHALVPALAHKVRGDGTAPDVDVPLAVLRAGDTVRVRPGERIPIDGVVVAGTSAVDESLLTGESEPIDKDVDAHVVGGSLNTTGSLLVRVEHTGDDTVLARITAAVAEAQGSRAPIARFADRASAVFVPIVLGLAALTFAAWWLADPTTTGASVAIEYTVAVLVIACPCALGLATPAAVAVGAGRGAELGVLFRTGAALETASHVDTVYFDKTGTLTHGRPDVVAIEPLAARDESELLHLAASVELGSEHPFARAIVAAATARGVAFARVEGFVAVPAMGVTGRIDDTVVRVGKPEWLGAQGVDVAPLAARIAALEARGVTALVVARATTPVGLLGLADALRPDSPGALRALRTLDVRIGMLTGDRPGVAAAIAAPLALDDVAAGLLPTDKAARITAARDAGRRVAMVGDGVNDAPALAVADLGIAVGGGADVAAAAADVTLLHGGLAGVPTALALARATLRTIRRNLVWASVYNLLGIPVAAGVFAGQGLVLSPVFASAAMSLSSVSVLLSSLWLRRFRPPAAADRSD